MVEDRWFPIVIVGAGVVTVVAFAFVVFR